MYGFSVLSNLKTLIKSLGPQARMRRRLAKKYLCGEGIEIGALHNPLRTSARVKYVDRLSRADLRQHYPELAALHLVDPDIIDDGETLRRIEEASQDFIIANHFIEHCEDPIGTLQTFANRLHPGGVIYLAVPDKRFSFDKERPSTSFGHLEADHRDGGVSTKWSHYFEFAQYACFNRRVKDSIAHKQASKMMAEGYSIHFHVWTTEEFDEFLRRTQSQFVPQLEVLEVVRNGEEGIFILRRT